MTLFAWIVLVCFAVCLLPGTDYYRHKHEFEDFAWDTPWIYLVIAANVASVILALGVVLR